MNIYNVIGQLAAWNSSKIKELGSENIESVEPLAGEFRITLTNGNIIKVLCLKVIDIEPDK